MATKEQRPTPCRNAPFQLNANTFTRTGYSFLGWTENWQSTEVQYEDGAEVTFDGDRDLYAIWEPSKYTVTLRGNPNTESWWGIANVKFPDVPGTPQDTNIEVTYDENYPTIPKPTATGYVFKNWYDGTARTHFPDRADA